MNMVRWSILNQPQFVTSGNRECVVWRKTKYRVPNRKTLLDGLEDTKLHVPVLHQTQSCRGFLLERISRYDPNTVAQFCLNDPDC